MLEKVVLFDRFSASFNSKAFSTLHLRIDQDFLDSNKFPEEKRSQNYTLFELGENFFLDPANNSKHLNIIINSVPIESHSNVIKSIEHKSGLFFNHFGIGSVDPYCQILINLSSMLRKFDTNKIKKNREFEVARLFFGQSLKKNKYA